MKIDLNTMKYFDAIPVQMEVATDRKLYISFSFDPCIALRIYSIQSAVDATAFAHRECDSEHCTSFQNNKPGILTCCHDFRFSIKPNFGIYYTTCVLCTHRHTQIIYVYKYFCCCCFFLRQLDHLKCRLVSLID